MKKYNPIVYLFILTFLSFISLSQAFAQETTLKGRVIASNGEALSFANVHIKNTSKGTTTNGEGYYFLNLAQGQQYEIIFQYIGYKTQYITVNANQSPIELNVTLEPESLELTEIVINAKDDDPAYEIIRKAMDKRRDYLTETESYRCQTYLKGLTRLDKAPKAILGMSISVDTGVVYFSESVSRLAYQRPDQYREEMIASKVSGDPQGFSFNQASEMIGINLYENMIANGNFSERGLISPIAINAMLYYRYHLEGTFEEGGLLINKIKITPRRADMPAFSGYVYIIEDSWRLHSAELYLNKGQLEFVDSVSIQQTYRPAGDVWITASQKFYYFFKTFGFEGNGYFVCNYTDYEINPTFERRFFNNEVLNITQEVNQKDSLYWENIRPVKLTIGEIKEYQTKDSLRIIKESKPYLDSVDRKRNKLSIGNIYLGYTYQNSYKKYSLSFDPLLNTISYNTVEGWVVDFSVRYQKEFKDKRSISIKPTGRYGFSTEQFYGKINTTYEYNPFKFGLISLEGGHYVEQLSRLNSIDTYLNTAYTLLNEDNFMKIYQKTYAKLNIRHEIFNGIMLYAGLEYARRNPMQNKSDYTYIDINDKVYTSNTPLNQELNNTDFTENDIFIYNIGLRFRANQEYITMPNEKMITDVGKLPALRIDYRGSSEFDQIKVSLRQQFYLGLLGSFTYMAEYGTFLREPTRFIDYQHFIGNQTIIGDYELGNYQLLDYYAFSTAKSYIKAHAEQHFNGFFLNGIPLLKKLRWQEVVTGNYLYTEALGNYFELGAGIEHIFKIIRVDYFWGFQENNNNFLQGIRVGFGF
ncbi:MAG: carboxypeptidase-like regulatory domain-containing protein [Cytophagales bacterium]|nr:MAG: carboxypeptidase-like regulatory domain-containing protein [Cytophagales bacterium]